MLMLVPIIIGLVGLLASKGKLTVKEFICLELACLVIVGLGYGISRWTATSDTEIWSGRITGKEKNTVSCEHSYSCNCRETCSGSGSSRSCSQTCDTCYEHSHDYDWDLYTNINSTITIDRVDRQGVDMPSRWGTAFINEPVAIEHSFTNYIKANPKTVLTRIGNKPIEGLPVPLNPVETYDYYRVNRFLQVGYADPNARDWNWLLNELNATYGPSKQVNVIVVAVKTANPDYSYLLEEKWLGGKKNDLIVLIGVPEYPKIAWVKILSWSKAENLKVELRDSIMEIGSMERRNDILKATENQIRTNWQRRHMKDFEYLMAGMQPSTGWTVFLFVFGTLVSLGLAIYFWNEDPFGDDVSAYQSTYSSYRNPYIPKSRIIGRRY